MRKSGREKGGEEKIKVGKCREIFLIKGIHRFGFTYINRNYAQVM